jgi:DMSO/TMAO reductase YedYZ molybdopterin-dependent catalytic subunit
MTKLSRRRLIGAGLGVAGLTAAEKLAARYGLVPPDGGGLYGPGETLTYAAQRVLTRHSMAHEFDRSRISQRPFANPVDPPLSDGFRKLQAGGFTDWRVTLDGMVSRPRSFSVEELRAMPARSQITSVQCEEGWNYIAEWTGVPLAHVLDVSGALPQARYVVYRSFQPDWWESIDMADALHPQTILAHRMNGAELPVPFGGPVRLRVPRQLGYKSVKYIARLTVTDDLKKFGKGLGSASPEGGYSWYAGI